MELTKKTTILFPEPFYRGLERVAKARRTSVGKLVRDACCKQYGLPLAADAVAAAEKLAALKLPVDTVPAMKRQLTPEPAELQP